MVAELENQFSDLARLLQEENPDQASKLIDAFKASKEMLLEKRMDDITKLLDLSKLDSANEEQKKTIDDIKGLIEFLLKEDDESERIKKEIEKLKKWKADLESLIQDESELKDESELRSEKDKALEEMDRNIAELKRLIDKQKEIKEVTDKESTNGIEGLDKIADAQNELRKETEKLQGSLGQEDKNDLEEKNKPANLKKDAVNDQKLAEQKLGEGKGKPAAESESEAIDKMQKALNGLEEERNRIAGIDPEDLQELTEDQKETAQETAKLSEEIEKSNGSEGDSDQQQDPLKAGQEAAQNAIDSANEKMNSAAGQLAEGNPGQAAQQQKEAIEDFRKFITDDYGDKYLPKTPNSYTGKKAKNAQEAHEAIRPTNISRKPSDIKKYVNADQFKLYELIWSRALSSQMNPAEFDRNTIIISSNDNKINFRASGSVVKFDGFLKVYQVQETDEDTKNILPEVKVGEEISILKLNDEQHFTDPPPRYSEASLVKKMEELGIGRPSTYASIISVLSTRNYVELINKRFNPTDRGKLISAFLEKLFSKYVDYNFTADLENQLDEITSGKIEWVQVLDNFWKDFYENVGKVKEKRTREVLDLLNESLGALIFERDDKDAIDRKCKLCSNGELSLKNSFRGGAFIGCSNYPECKFTRPLSKAKAAAQYNLAEPKLLGQNEKGKDIYLKNGRFGPYLQYEKEKEELETKKKKGRKKKNENEHLKNVSIPKGIDVDSVDLDKAKYLCSLPKVLGQHPENGQDITLNSGRFGPYLKCENKSARLENVEDLFSIGINRAITLIAEAKPGRISSSLIKDLGEHPEDKKPVRIMKGQYGPYIKYKSLNATIPEEKDPNELTMEEALVLIEKRKEYDKAKKKGKRK